MRCQCQRFDQLFAETGRRPVKLSEAKICPRTSCDDGTFMSKVDRKIRSTFCRKKIGRNVLRRSVPPSRLHGNIWTKIKCVQNITVGYNYSGDPDYRREFKWLKRGWFRKHLKSGLFEVRISNSLA